MKPLLSIITVTYNAADTLGRTLESVDSQSFTGYEHLVVDGASTDGTLRLTEQHLSPRRRVISEKDSGLYDAMNKGICNTDGTYLLFLNAGDKFHDSDVLQRIADAIEANHEPGILYGQTLIVDKDGKNGHPRHLTAPAVLTLKSFADGMVVCHQAFVAHRKIISFYNLKYRYSADYEWCIRCLQHSRHNVYLGDEPIIDYLEDGLTTRNRNKSLRERFRIMCCYYGTLPTIFRHFRFLLRHLRRKN